MAASAPLLGPPPGAIQAGLSQTAAGGSPRVQALAAGLNAKAGPAHPNHAGLPAALPRRAAPAAGEAPVQRTTIVIGYQSVDPMFNAALDGIAPDPHADADGTTGLSAA